MRDLPGLGRSLAPLGVRRSLERMRRSLERMRRSLGTRTLRRH
jgi:hypothetical protein